jgi:hypothetical protein
MAVFPRNSARNEMKALIYRGSHVLEFSDAADPVPQPDEVLVAQLVRIPERNIVTIPVEAVGICGSDMHAWHGHLAGGDVSSARMPIPWPISARPSRHWHLDSSDRLIGLKTGRLQPVLPRSALSTKVAALCRKSCYGPKGARWPP